MIIQVLVAAVATFGFSIRFQVPARQYLGCATVGGAAWLVRYLLLYCSFSESAAVFGATLTLVIISRLFSVFQKTPTILFLFAGIFCLVPGAGIYYTAYAIFSANAVLAGQYALQTLMIAGAIVLGILFGYFVPQPLFNGVVNLFKSKADG